MIYDFENKQAAEKFKNSAAFLWASYIFNLLAVIKRLGITMSCDCPILLARTPVIAPITTQTAIASIVGVIIHSFHPGIKYPQNAPNTPPIATLNNLE